MTPSHIEVNRCDGGCFHRQQSCLPVRVKKTNIPVSTSLNRKKPAKMQFKKFVKLTSHTCSCNDLTNFEYQVRAMTGNGNCVDLLKLVWKNS